MADKKITRVWSPMKASPDYTLSPDATPEEIRATVVRAMRDELTVQWFSEKDFIYRSKAGQDMNVKSDEVYAGMAYVTSATSLFHWLRFYDFKTGKMSGIGPDMDGKMGNTCASSVFWGWYAAVSSIRGCYTFHMTPANGFLPVGDYTIDPALESLNDHHTDEIIRENGKEKIIDAYTRVKPGDAIVAFKDAKSAHAQMVVEPATVVYREGVIDLDESYLVVQDQHKGLRSTKAEFVNYYAGGKVHFAGHLAMKRPFSKLLKDAYLPLTNAEFEGKKPYTGPFVKAEGAEGLKTLSDVRKLTLVSSYPVVAVDLAVREGDRLLGESSLLTTRDDMKAFIATALPLKELPLPELSGKGCRCTITITLSCGAVLTAADFICE
ncbi:MAG: hypothetical protein J6Z79_07115 [Clostridia bacterium]|nr:hypothetical protein [Clostridia bacterium]